MNKTLCYDLKKLRNRKVKGEEDNKLDNWKVGL
jgi:hypothetical protein